jgi:P-type Ca2+ transporter type 2C
MMAAQPALEQPWASTSEAVLAALGVSLEEGLSDSEALSRRQRFGPNLLRTISPPSGFEVLGSQFRSLIVWLLLAATLAAFLFGEYLDGWAILAVVAVTIAIGFFTELRAVRSMDALRKLGTVQTVVRRNGESRTVPATDLVPGDLVLLESGDLVVADLRLVEASKVQADQSPLTGESFPVGKSTEPVSHSAPLAERSCLIFKGSAVTRGSGMAVVVGTGMSTEVGKIASLVAQAQEEQTPLEKRLQSLGRELVWVSLITTALIAVAGMVAGQTSFVIIKTAVALAVATVPEGLPVIATMTLARGMWRMARRNALVNRLSSVETLGATTVIITDKTGTLTENHLTVTEMVLADGQQVPPTAAAARPLLLAGVLCNNASLGHGKAVGDPLEVALLEAGRLQNLEREMLLQHFEEIKETAFDHESRLMATYHRDSEQILVAVKGAPEAVLAACESTVTASEIRPLSDEQRADLLSKSEELAGSGLRVLGLADKRVRLEEPPYQDLTFLGLVGLSDPPRSEVKDALKACREAGIRVVMVTGDQAATALAVGRKIGLISHDDESALPATTRGVLALDGQLFYRATPADKLELLKLHQENGAVVAMLGDGVNDAPALKQAHVGVAMGLRGTQVARQAADVVLMDDQFSTILSAIENGRTIFSNIRKFAMYLLSCNLSELMIVALATVSALPLPITPLQILYLNLVTDVFPALALGLGPGRAEVMRHPPQDPREAILGSRQWLFIGGYALLITFVVLTVFGLALHRLGLSPREAVTLSFLTLGLAQVWHVFNLAEGGGLRNEVTTNGYVWLAVFICLGALGASLTLPGLATVLQTSIPSGPSWILVLSASLIPLLVGQLLKSVKLT